MKRAVRFVFVLLAVSCANERSKEREMSIRAQDAIEYEINAGEFTVADLASEKLLGYFELVKLKNEHPEFTEAIAVQLRQFSKGGLVKIEDSSFSIKNIRNVGDVITVSDSVQSLRLYYDIAIGQRTRTDSIQALITSKKLILEGEEVKTTKVTFSTID